MSKLNFPNVGKPYRGMVELYRAYFQEIASHVEKSTGLAAVIRSQIQPLLTAIGYTPSLPATQTIVSNGQVRNPVTVTGSGTTATFTVSGGQVTGIALS